MDKNYSEINEKTLTKQFVYFLETSIADEVILSSFIRKINILFHSDKVLHVGVESSFAVGFLKTNYSKYFSAAALEILSKKLEPVFFETSKYKQTVSLKEVKKLSKKDIETVNRSFFHINKKYNFDNFVVASFNKKAIDASLAVIKDRGKYNPLFIFSSSGFGKTHLLHSIGNKLSDQGKLVHYVSPNIFTNEVKKCFENKKNTIEELKSKYSSVDYLLVDDVQFFANRVKTMEVFFDIFNRVVDSGKQIIFASDKVFDELGGFDNRFISRFGSGLVIKLRTPSFGDFKKIINKKISIHPSLSKRKWKSSAIDFLARNNNSSVRSVESSLTRVEFLLSSCSKTIDVDDKLLEAFFKGVFIDEKHITPDRIIDEVSKYYGVNKHSVLSVSRKREFILPRHISMYFCRKINQLSFAKIGELFGNRNHSTVITAIDKIQFSIKSNSTTSTAISTIENKIRKMT